MAAQGLAGKVPAVGGKNVLTIPEKYASHRSVEEHLNVENSRIASASLDCAVLGHAAYHRDQAPWLMNSPMAIWSVAGGACLALGVMHFLVWCGDRNLRASLWFTGVTMPVVFMAWLESSIVHASTTEMFCILHRWGHVSFFITFVCVIGFIRSYFGTTRSWILWPLLGVRAVILVLAFVPGPTFNFREVSSLVPYNFLGETLIAPVGVRSSWEFLGNISGILLAIFVIDGGIRLWRIGGRRERQRALIVSAGVLLFLLSCAVNGLLIHHHILQVPYFITLSFLFIVVAMEIELSRDLRSAASMSREFKENVESMNLAAEAVQLALWRSEITDDRIWVSPRMDVKCSALVLTKRSTSIVSSIPWPLKPRNLRQMQLAITGGGRNPSGRIPVALPHGKTRWIRSHGRVEFDSDHKPLRMRGVSTDVSRSREVESAAARHQAENYSPDTNQLAQWAFRPARPRVGPTPCHYPQ